VIKVRKLSVSFGDRAVIYFLLAFSLTVLVGLLFSTLFSVLSLLKPTA